MENPCIEEEEKTCYALKWINNAFHDWKWLFIWIFWHFLIPAKLIELVSLCLFSQWTIFKLRCRAEVGTFKQFLSYLYTYLERKAKSINANPKLFKAKAKHKDEAQTIKKESIDIESVQELLTTLKLNQSMASLKPKYWRQKCWSTKAKPKAKSDVHFKTNCYI